jgi:hypothetical protein
MARARAKTKGQADAWPFLITCFRKPVHPWSKGSRYRLGVLEIASGHFARLVVALHVVANLLALDDFAHTGALDGRNVDECVRTALVRLNEAEALGGIEPFNCACGHDEPFHSNIEEPQRRGIADGGSDF